MRRNVVNKDMSNLNNVRNVLKEGDEGEDVEKLQNMLMSIVHIYPTLPVVTLDGKYNSETRNAVEEFQNMMGQKNQSKKQIEMQRILKCVR